MFTVDLYLVLWVERPKAGRSCPMNRICGYSWCTLYTTVHHGVLIFQGPVGGRTNNGSRPDPKGCDPSFSTPLFQHTWRPLENPSSPRAYRDLCDTVAAVSGPTKKNGQPYMSGAPLRMVKGFAMCAGITMVLINVCGALDVLFFDKSLTCPLSGRMHVFSSFKMSYHWWKCNKYWNVQASIVTASIENAGLWTVVLIWVRPLIWGQMQHQNTNDVWVW